MSVSEIQLFNILKEKLGEAEAQSLVEYVDNRVNNEFEKRKDSLATKQDISELKAEFKQDKSEIIKWMFIFWVGQIAAVIAIIKFLM